LRTKTIQKITACQETLGPVYKTITHSQPKARTQPEVNVETQPTFTSYTHDPQAPVSIGDAQCLLRQTKPAYCREKTEQRPDTASQTVKIIEAKTKYRVPSFAWRFSPVFI